MQICKKQANKSKSLGTNNVELFEETVVIGCTAIVVCLVEAVVVSTLGGFVRGSEVSLRVEVTLG